MATEQFTAKRKLLLRENLESQFDFYIERIDGMRNISQVYDCLGTIVFTMKHLGLSTFKGRLYSDFKRLHDYIGRMFFHRRLSVSLQDFQSNGVVGLDRTGDVWGHLPTRPSELGFKFQLEGLNGRKVLVCSMGTWTDWSGPNYLNQHQLVVSLGRYDGHLYAPTTEVAMRYREGRPRRFRGERVINARDAVNDAYERSGVIGVWHELDKVWVNQAAARPMTRSLTQQSINTRWMVHKHQPVRIITVKGSHVGILDEVIRTVSDEIQSVLVMPSDDESFEPSIPASEILASEILEILPHRLDQATLSLAF